LCQLERSPADEGVYFVSGDPSDPADLERAGIQEAAAALIFPAERTDEADMKSILTVLAIESMAPQVRTIVEVNNSRHVEHFRRAHADEVLVPSHLAARLAARTALYPGLTELVTDIVTGGEGSELYRIQLPDVYVGTTVEELSRLLLREHRATLMAIARDTESFVNPPADMRIEPGDEALIVAESISTLRPLKVTRLVPQTTSG
jgi:voltage-gated potassium channel